MKIAVIADTHMPKFAKQLPRVLRKGLQDVDLIIHAGDWQTMEVYEELKKIAPIEGVYGNVDSEDIIKLLSRRKIINVGPYSIGIVHGHGKSGTTEKRALKEFENDDVDVIVFGHSHIPLKKQIDDRLLFNPGSPTSKRKLPQFSYGIMTITDKLQAEHIYFTDKS